MRMKDQRRETRGRKPKLYRYKRRWLSLSELAELSGLPASTIRDRMKSGKTPEEAVSRDTFEQEAMVVSYRGQEHTLEEWAKIDWVKRRKITKSKLYARLYQDPVWTKEEAFGDALRERPGAKKITVETPDGPVEKTMTAWSKHTGIPLATISMRRSRGWTDAQALGFEPGPQELRDAEQAEDDDEQDE